MALNTKNSPHIHAQTSVTAIMLNVVLALLPALFVYLWFFGWGLLVHIVIASITALLSEALILYLRKKPVVPALMDGSALVTAILIAFCIPPLAPWWITFVGTAFAIIIAKHLYGGLGYNPFNPAMVGYAMLLISFPREMTSWISPDEIKQLGFNLAETIDVIISELVMLDALSMATPLDTAKTELTHGNTLSIILQNTSLFATFGSSFDSSFGNFFGNNGWGWVNCAFVFGGGWLLIKKIIHWHIPVAILLSLFLFASTFHLFDNEHYLSPMLHLFSGATMICAFFIATDPVTASTTFKGRLIYGTGIGALIYIIRTWGGYPDAVAFAVLLMNIAVPTIDYYTQPRVFGHGKSDKK